MIKVNGKPLEKDFTFPGGEVQVRLSKEVLDSKLVWIDAHIRSSEDVMKLMLVTDVLIRELDKDVERRLNIHYFPYARQDRVCYPGEAESKAVMLDILGYLKYDVVTVADLHSDTPHDGLITNEITQLEIFNDNPQILKGVTALVAPDKGSVKKTREIANHFNLPVVTCDKVRNPDTGELTGIEIIDTDEYVDVSRMLVIDDICDGGGTFILLSEMLAKEFGDISSELNLYVTHGIFSKGTDILLDHYDKLFTTDSYYEGESSSYVEVIKL